MIKEFLKPSSVEEAVSLKQKLGAKACYLGGGSRLNRSAHNYETAISLENLQLNAISATADALSIGSQVTLQELIDSAEVSSVLKEAALHMASRNMRNQSTVGGHLVVNDIDATLVPCLTALQAVVLTSEGDQAIDDYLAQSKDCLILSVRIPKSERKVALKKVAIQSQAIPALSVAVAADLNGGKVENAVIALAGMEKGTVRLGAVEHAWMNGECGEKSAVEKMVSETVQFQSDLQGSAEYKNYICGVTIADLIEDLK